MLCNQIIQPFTIYNTIMTADLTISLPAKSRPIQLNRLPLSGEKIKSQHPNSRKSKRIVSRNSFFWAFWQQCFVDFSCLVGHKIITFLLWPCLPLLSLFKLAASHQNFWANQSQESTLLILFAPLLVSLSPLQEWCIFTGRERMNIIVVGKQ